MEVLFGALLTIAVTVVILAAKRGAEAAQRERHTSLREVPAGPLSPPGSVGARAPASSIFSATAPGHEGRLGQALTGAAATGRNGDPSATPTLPRSPVAGATGVAGAQKPSAPSSPGREAPRRPRAEPDSWWDTSARPASRQTRSRPTARRELPPIDLNAASVEELQGLPGIGVRAASRIAEHRARHGRFKSVDDLETVEGFDQHRVARLAPRAIV